MAFPSNPVVGDLYTNTQGVEYIFTNRGVWKVNSANGGSGGAGGVITWLPNTNYVKNQLVEYRNTVLFVLNDHISSPDISLDGDNLAWVSGPGLLAQIDISGLTTYDIKSPFGLNFFVNLNTDIVINVPATVAGQKIVLYFSNSSGTDRVVSIQSGGSNISRFVDATADTQPLIVPPGQSFFTLFGLVIHDPLTPVWAITAEGNFPFKGATASRTGTPGAVPLPLVGQEGFFLRGDGVWAEVISGGGGVVYTSSDIEPLNPNPGDMWYNTTNEIVYIRNQDANGDFWLDISSVYSGSNTFTTISVSGQPALIADSPEDTLNIQQGPGISLTTDPATDTLIISSTVSVSEGPLAHNASTPYSVGSRAFYAGIEVIRTTGTTAAPFEWTQWRPTSINVANWRGVWSIGTNYVVGDVMVESSTSQVLYYCTANHASSNTGFANAIRTPGGVDVNRWVALVTDSHLLDGNQFFIGSTALADGKQGVVPRPLVNDRNRYLKGNGQWGDLTVSTVTPHFHQSTILGADVNLVVDTFVNLPNIVASNMTFNTSNGFLTLLAGRTYELAAIFKCRFTGSPTNVYVQIDWFRSTGTRIGDLQSAIIIPVNGTVNETTNQIAGGFYTPSNDEQVAPRVTALVGTGWQIDGQRRSTIMVKQIGLSTVTAVS